MRYIALTVQKSDKTPGKRTSKRFPLRLPVALKTDSVQHSAETENISSGGVLFTVSARLEVATPIEFKIVMPAEVLGTPSDVVVSCSGRVVRCSDEGQHRAVAAVIDEYRFERS